MSTSRANNNEIQEVDDDFFEFGILQNTTNGAQLAEYLKRKRARDGQGRKRVRGRLFMNDLSDDEPLHNYDNVVITRKKQPLIETVAQPSEGNQEVDIAPLERLQPTTSSDVFAKPVAGLRGLTTKFLNSGTALARQVTQNVLRRSTPAAAAINPQQILAANDSIVMSTPKENGHSLHMFSRSAALSPIRRQESSSQHPLIISRVESLAQPKPLPEILNRLPKELKIRSLNKSQHQMDGIRPIWEPRQYRPSTHPVSNLSLSSDENISTEKQQPVADPDVVVSSSHSSLEIDIVDQSMSINNPPLKKRASTSVHFTPLQKRPRSSPQKTARSVIESSNSNDDDQFSLAEIEMQLSQNRQIIQKSPITPRSHLPNNRNVSAAPASGRKSILKITHRRPSTLQSRIDELMSDDSGNENDVVASMQPKRVGFREDNKPDTEIVEPQQPEQNKNNEVEVAQAEEIERADRHRSSCNQNSIHDRNETIKLLNGSLNKPMPRSKRLAIEAHINLLGTSKAKSNCTFGTEGFESPDTEPESDIPTVDNVAVDQCLEPPAEFRNLDVIEKELEDMFEGFADTNLRVVTPVPTTTKHFNRILIHSPSKNTLTRSSPVVTPIPSVETQTKSPVEHVKSASKLLQSLRTWGRKMVDSPQSDGSILLDKECEHIRSSLSVLMSQEATETVKNIEFLAPKAPSRIVKGKKKTKRKSGGSPKSSVDEILKLQSSTVANKSGRRKLYSHVNEQNDEPVATDTLTTSIASTSIQVPLDLRRSYRKSLANVKNLPRTSSKEKSPEKTDHVPDVSVEVEIVTAEAEEQEENVQRRQAKHRRRIKTPARYVDNPQPSTSKGATKKTKEPKKSMKKYEKIKAQPAVVKEPPQPLEAPLRRSSRKPCPRANMMSIEDFFEYLDVGITRKKEYAERREAILEKIRNINAIKPLSPVREAFSPIASTRAGHSKKGRDANKKKMTQKELNRRPTRTRTQQKVLPVTTLVNKALQEDGPIQIDQVLEIAVSQADISQIAQQLSQVPATATVQQIVRESSVEVSSSTHRNLKKGRQQQPSISNDSDSGVNSMLSTPVGWMRQLMDFNSMNERAMAIPMEQNQFYSHSNLDNLQFIQKTDYDICAYANDTLDEQYGYIRFKPHGLKDYQRSRRFGTRLFILIGELELTCKKNDDKKEILKSRLINEGSFVCIQINQRYKLKNTRDSPALVFYIKILPAERSS